MKIVEVEMKNGKKKITFPQGFTLDKDSAVDLKVEFEKMKEDIERQRNGFAGQLDESVFNLARDTKYKYAYVICTEVEEKEEEDGISVSASLNLSVSDDPNLKCAMKFILEPIRAYIEYSGNRNWNEAKKYQAGMIAFLKKWNESHLEREQK